MSSLQVQTEKPFLGRYELQKKIAVGGMAELYLAQVNGVGGFQKQVVVKRILPQLAESEELFNMFLDEARIAATLQHPNVVQIHDCCQENGEYFMAMEYLDGTDLRTLRKVLADQAMPLPWEHALHIVTSISAGLHYAHDKRGLDGNPLGIVHRDVTPHNIFLTREGGVKLVDFGIAKAQGRMTETALGTLKGKLAYMSPEQCQGEEIDRRSDIYSLGIILFELTTGRRLYKGSTEYQLIKEIVEGEIKPPSSFMEYPEELEAIVLKCLEKNPEDRYASAREVQSDLEAFSREYQIMSSALGFSSFLEPLLEAAAATAEARWKHRKEAMPILTGESGAIGVPMRRPARGTSAPLPKPSSSPHPSELRAIPSIPSLMRKPAEPKPNAGIPSVSMYAEEELTVRVPTDTLERIRAEEKHLMEQERALSEADAIPRIARGTASGEHSVSANVVVRESSKIIVDQDDILDSIDLAIDEDEATVAAAPIPQAPASDAFDIFAATVTEPGSVPVNIAPPIVEAEAASRAVSHTAVVAKAKFKPALSERAASPQAEVFTNLNEQDLRVTRKNTSLWVTGVAALGLIGGGLAWSQQSSSTPASAVVPETPLTAEVGNLSVNGASGADVWLFLGRTPLQTIAVNGESQHRVRVEHEGYHSLETTLGSNTWKRDDNGTLHAVGVFRLQADRYDVAVPETTDASESESSQARPASLQVSSMPSSANAWLFVGTTPNVTLGNLDLSSEVQLRIEQGDAPPKFRVLNAADFDAAGQASIEVAEVAVPAPPAPVAVEAPKAEAAPVKKWRPRRNKPKSAGAAQPLSGPTPDWAK